MNEIPFFATSAAFAMRARQLATTLYEQRDGCLAAHGIELPGYTTSIVQTLYHAGPQSISDLAQRLALSQEATTRASAALADRPLGTRFDLPATATRHTAGAAR